MRATIACLLLFFAACDPAKQIVMRNQAQEHITLRFEHHDKSDTVRVELAPGEEKNMFLGFGTWERPVPKLDPTGRCTGVAFGRDHHFDAIDLRASASELKVRRRYLLKNGLVLLVK